MPDRCCGEAPNMPDLDRLGPIGAFMCSKNTFGAGWSLLQVFFQELLVASFLVASCY